MRSNQNLEGSSNGSVAGKLSMPRMPLEWLDAGCWRLPSGKALAEFALQAGFLAPLLLRSERLQEQAPGTEPPLGESVLSGASNDFEKGESR
ncbi:MAG TPA: hypothetical protein VEV17_25145 [Bryobacteraceae bacterium]|nr:hypothetical protein [Bryobacteraceae bacterium]